MKRKTIKWTWCMMALLPICACQKSKTEQTQDQQVSATIPANLNIKSSFSLGAVGTIIHPGLLHNAADFARMTGKVNASAQPWLSGWNKLVANPHSSSSYVMKGPVVKIVDGAAADGSPMNFMTACEDAAAAYQNALRWKIKGDVACGNKAIAIMNAWANTCTGFNGDSNIALAAGLQGYQWANAAEIMRAYSGWASADFTKFKNFLVNVYYPVNSDFLTRHNGTCDTHYWLNWDTSNMCSALAIGILADDAAKVNFAINYYIHTGVGNGYIGRVAWKAYANGMAQPQEAGRDQGHATMVVPLLGAFMQMAYNQGQNLFDYNPWAEVNPRMLGMSEYVAAYNINTTNTVSYTAYNNCDNVNQTVISTTGRGTIRPGWELVYNYYVKVKGSAAPYTTQFATNIRPEGGGGDYGSNSGGYDQLGFGTLTFSR